ncbi:MAG: hypothetical protein COA50_00280 [Flavobacteriaceae bacterium]|nr:MAG: hypothetical protein COA50_00280 [Flavobacteriaceae bacterium]
MSEFLTMLPIMLPIYTALYFISVKKYPKFILFKKAIIGICLLFAFLSLSWNSSAYFFSFKIPVEIIDSELERILKKHEVNFVYYAVIPELTIVYVIILDYIFKPKNKSKK